MLAVLVVLLRSLFDPVTLLDASPSPMAPCDGAIVPVMVTSQNLAFSGCVLAAQRGAMH